MPETPKAHIKTGSLELVVLGEQAILEAQFALSPRLHRAVRFVIGVMVIWSVEQCLRWLSAMLAWMAP